MCLRIYAFCGRGLFGLVGWLNVRCVRLSVCIDACVLKLTAHGGSYSGLRKDCVDGVICV